MVSHRNKAKRACFLLWVSRSNKLLKNHDTLLLSLNISYVNKLNSTLNQLILYLFASIRASFLRQMLFINIRNSFLNTAELLSIPRIDAGIL